MAYISHIDNCIILSKCYVTRSYAQLRDQIIGERDHYTNTIMFQGEVFGYTITKNEPLTELYGFPCWVVRFMFSNIDTLHHEEQERVLLQLCNMLQDEMRQNCGYYNLRIPVHIVDLTKAVNRVFQQLIFCGSTVEWVHMDKSQPAEQKNDINIFIPDRSFVQANREYLMQLAYDSFAIYQGQYHISPITAPLAGQIYSNWIKHYIDDFKEGRVIVAQYQNEIVGFLLVAEEKTAIEGVLAAVSRKRRRLGAYKTIISYILQYSKEKNKLFVTSTQSDNYIVQGTWCSLGLRPFNTINNMHLDYRNQAKLPL